MHKLIDKLLLFGLCLLAMTLTDIEWISVVAMLVAVAVSSLNSYFENTLSICMSAAYVALCFIIPGFAIFLPVIVYDCAGMDRLVFRLCWCVALPVCFISFDWPPSAVVALSSGAAFLLHYRTSAEINTQSAFLMLTDDAKESTALMERRHRELMEKQDYEIRLATLAERNRIAREIHDNVGHLLTRSILQLDALRITCSGDDRLAQEAEVVKKTLSDAMDSIRSSVHDLHDESVNLSMQLEEMSSGFKFCPVKLRCDAGELPMEIRICFAAIVREALSNIARHSSADEASVTVTSHPAFCRMVIRDNGTKKPGKTTKGIGLQNMEDRVTALGGIFRAEYDNGFKIFVSVPNVSVPNKESLYK